MDKAIKTYTIEKQSTPVRIGDDAEVLLTVYESEKPGLTYVTLHDDEDTAAQAVLDVIARRGGRLIDLQHSGDRNIVFTLAADTFVFDPNRIYSDNGAKATLEGLGGFSPAALREVRAFAKVILQRIRAGGDSVLVTVHNNTEGEYSTLSYLEGGLYAGDALLTRYLSDVNIDNFFFVTEQWLFDRLSEGHHNIVLQNNATVLEDGSLSVWAARQQIPYVNVEAQHGRLSEQIEMLDYLTDSLRNTATAASGV